MLDLVHYCYKGLGSRGFQSNVLIIFFLESKGETVQVSISNPFEIIQFVITFWKNSSVVLGNSGAQGFNTSVNLGLACSSPVGEQLRFGICQSVIRIEYCAHALLFHERLKGVHP